MLLASLFLMVASSALAEELLPYGAYGTTIHGSLQPGEKKIYFLDGKKGQVLKAETRDRKETKNVHLGFFYKNGGSVLGDLPDNLHFESLDLILPKTAAYELHVYSLKHHCSFVLEATVEDAPSEAPKKSPWLLPQH